MPLGSVLAFFIEKKFGFSSRLLPGLMWINSIKLMYYYIKFMCYYINLIRASLIAQLVKNPPAMRETPGRFLGLEDPLEKG